MSHSMHKAGPSRRHTCHHCQYFEDSEYYDSDMRTCTRQTFQPRKPQRRLSPYCPVHNPRQEKHSIPNDICNSPWTAVLAKKMRESHRFDKLPRNTKSLMDRLEEAYWASWKPKKDHQEPSEPSKCTFDKGCTSKSDEDSSSTFVEYFTKTGFATSTASMGIDPEYQNTIRANSREIQTEPVIFLTQCSGHQTITMPKNVTTAEKAQQVEFFTDESVKETISDVSMGFEEEPMCVEEPMLVDQGRLPMKYDGNFLKHKDSLILATKHQHDEKKAEQPEYIKLSKKISKPASYNYIRGGTYPLKSCLKKEPSALHNNFKLGPPGSPMFVTPYSFNRKYNF